MKLFKVAVVAASLAVAGCSWLPWQGGNVEAQVAEVQELCKRACSFLPTAQTVAAIISAGDPTVAGASAIAKAICDQVTKAIAENPALKTLPKTEAECPYGKVAGACIDGKPL
jgi:precorrin-3B methylase